MVSGSGDQAGGVADKSAIGGEHLDDFAQLCADLRRQRLDLAKPLGSGIPSAHNPTACSRRLAIDRAAFRIERMCGSYPLSRTTAVLGQEKPIGAVTVYVITHSLTLTHGWHMKDRTIRTTRDSATLLAEFRTALACRMQRAGLSDERLGKRIGFNRTTVNKVRNGLLDPSPQFAQKVEQELGQDLWDLWAAWDAARQRDGARQARTSTRSLEPQADTIRTREFVAWVADHSHLTFQEAYEAVVTRVGRLQAEVAAVRYDDAYRRGQVTREQIAEALASYYQDPSPGDAGATFYRARVGGAPLTLSILVRPGWLGAAVELATDQERFRLTTRAPDPLPGPLGGALLEAALLRLAHVEVSGTVLVDSPVYRLLDVAIAPHCLNATVALADFASYALTLDLLETELITALVPGPLHTQARLPLRDTYLPSVTSALAMGERLCVGGPVALFAAARGRTRRSQGQPDYVLLVQERSSRVLNVVGKLAVVPKAFHGPTVEPAREASLSASLERELEEELLGRDDLANLSENSYRRADPFHPDHLSEPMRWLRERWQTDAYRIECVGFGINLLTGNYEFPCLIVIDDEEWWARYSGQVEANWEISRIRCYSSRDTAGLQALATDPKWSNEGLFAFLEGLRRLAEHGDGSRVALPRIEVDV